MGRKILITGASRGIGAASASYLASKGYVVFGTSRTPEKIKAKDPGVIYLRLDLNKKESIEACAREAGEIDILINNAGQSQIGPAEEFPLTETQDLFQANLFGLMLLTQRVLPHMRRKGRGAIINIGSMAGEFALPFQSSYVASKYALAGYSRSLRQEVKGCGIKVVLIEPNDIKTSIKPVIAVQAESAYIQETEIFMRSREKNMSSAHPPEVVARKIYSVLKKKHPKPAYAVGGMGPLLVFLKRLLPDKAVDKLVRKSYGLK
jgi:short-subunit dehydrogenase